MNAARKKITSVLIALALLFLPIQVKAQEEVVCNVIYGQGEVCRVEREGEVLGAHAPVGAGIEDISFISIATAFGLIGTIFFILSRKTKGMFLLDR